MPRTPLKITVLGSGTSMGVPTLGCPCRVCSSADPRDKRLRPSLLLSRNSQSVVIDPEVELLGMPFVPVPLLHGDMNVLGFRFGRAAYLTDFSSIPDSSMALLEGLDELILDALRDIPHPMHQTVDQALALIEGLKPRRAWFTHIAHDLPHAETNEIGRAHV